MSKKDNDINLEYWQSRVEELEKKYNTYEEVTSAFVDGFVLEQVSKISIISTETLQLWLSNPDDYMREITNLLNYNYIVDGDIFQLYDIIFSLPRLDYKISTYYKTDEYEEDIRKIRSCFDKKIKGKKLTRSVLIQLISKGTVIGTWLGNSKNPYFYIFNNLDYIFPMGKFRGEDVAVYDLSYLDLLSDDERIAQYNNLKPLITEAKYNAWKNEKNRDLQEKRRYVILPPKKTLVAKTHILNGNQRIGLPHGTQALFDIGHKQKMKELERSIADKVIRAMAILKFKGKDENDNVVTDIAKRKVFRAVKTALDASVKKKNSSISVVGLPDFADFKTAEIKGVDDALSSEKYNSVDDSITNATGIARGNTNGTKSNYSTTQINLDLLYSKIGVLLESIEEMYDQLINILLGEDKGMNYKFEFIKEKPLSKKEKVDKIDKLVSQGYAVKYLLDELGISREELLSETLYEIEELKLREKIIPPMTSYTLNGDDNSDNNGRNEIEEVDNDNTGGNKEIDGNSNPKPSTDN